MSKSTTEQALEAIETALCNLQMTGVDAAAFGVAVQGLVDARHILKQQIADEARPASLAQRKAFIASVRAIEALCPACKQPQNAPSCERREHFGC